MATYTFLGKPPAYVEDFLKYGSKNLGNIIINFPDPDYIYSGSGSISSKTLKRRLGSGSYTWAGLNFSGSGATLCFRNTGYCDAGGIGSGQINSAHMHNDTGLTVDKFKSATVHDQIGSGTIDINDKDGTYGTYATYDIYKESDTQIKLTFIVAD